MLNRTKVVLSVLQAAGSPLGSVALTKLVFLLQEEYDLTRIAGFYNFVPYKFGPYSFALHKELAALKRNGYVHESGDRWQLGRFVDSDRDWLSEVGKDVSSAVHLVLEKYGHLGREQLLRSVYSRYPWFAARSELSDLVPEDVPRFPRATPAIYTVGYQEKTVDGFLAALLSRGVEAIVDIRANPVSRNYGFAGRTLSSLAGRVNLSYHHIPQLGIPGNKRKNLTSPDKYQELFADYRDNMLPERRQYIESVAALMTEKPSTLLCYEASAGCCHRRPLAEAIAQHTGLPIIDLP